MSDLLLTIDQGNSNCTLTIYEGETSVNCITIAGALQIEAVEDLRNRYDISAVIYSSVKKVDSKLIESLRLLVSVENLLVLTHKTPLPIKIKYATPHTLGLDRIAACVGARKKYSGNLLVIDAGTAITFDVVNSAGEFIGGRIAPGIEMRFRALHDFTGLLPQASKITEVPFIGNDTISCLQSGVVRGVIAEIKEMAMSEISGSDINTIILTGGDSFYLIKELENHNINAVWDPSLVAFGLMNIYHYNEDN